MDVYFLVIYASAIYLTLYFWFLPIRSARFFDDHAELSGRGLRRTVSYSDIEEVIWSKTTFSVKFMIRLKGDDKMLRLIQNPTNANLKIDLHS